MHPTLSHAHVFARAEPARPPLAVDAADRPAARRPLATALLLVNTPTRVPDFLRAVWAAASCVVVADGAANRLLAALGARDAAAHLPDLICGDLDSLTSPTRCGWEGGCGWGSVRAHAPRAPGRHAGRQASADRSLAPLRRRRHCSAFYEGLGVPVEQDPDQDTTDLQKCMERLKTLQEARGVVRATASELSWRSHATRSHHRVL